MRRAAHTCVRVEENERASERERERESKTASERARERERESKHGRERGGATATHLRTASLERWAGLAARALARLRVEQLYPLESARASRIAATACVERWKFTLHF